MTETLREELQRLIADCSERMTDAATGGDVMETELMHSMLKEYVEELLMLGRT